VRSTQATEIFGNVSTAFGKVWYRLNLKIILSNIQQLIYATAYTDNALALGNLREYRRISDISLKLDSFGYISAAESIGVSSTTYVMIQFNLMCKICCQNAAGQ